MTKIRNLSGQKFGLLTVTRLADPIGGHTTWECVCDCGAKTTTRSSSLTRGSTRSCGCLQKKVASNTFKKHGGASSATYKSWACMIQRCENPKATGYRLYGGRGISVCDRWRNSFENFLSDMGERPYGTSIDRINSYGNYEPSNCRWANDFMQLNNTSRNRFIVHDGLTLTLAQWSERLGVNRNTVGRRLREGWDEIRAVTTPLQKQKPQNY